MALIPSGSTAFWTRPPLLAGNAKQTPRTEFSECLFLFNNQDLPVSLQIFLWSLHIFPPTKLKCSNWFSPWRSADTRNGLSMTHDSCNFCSSRGTLSPIEKCAQMHTRRNTIAEVSFGDSAGLHSHWKRTWMSKWFCIFIFLWWKLLRRAPCTLTQNNKMRDVM